MQERLGNGVTAQQFREMQREIARAEQDLTRLRQSADSLNEVEQAADAAEKDIVNNSVFSGSNFSSLSTLFNSFCKSRLCPLILFSAFVNSYANLSIPEALELPMDIFLLYLRDGFIHHCRKTPAGMEYYWE